MNDYESDELEAGQLDTDHVLVRTLRQDDVDSVVGIDAASTGIRRTAFFKSRIRRSLEESSIHLSLAAELDDRVVGFMTVTFFQGEFGHPEAIASLDALGVHPDYRKKHVAKALLRQLEMNLRALGVDTLRTQVDWDQFHLLGFFSDGGFTPAATFCLEKRLTR